MEEVILNAFERTTTSKKLKGTGFVSGVIYGDSVKEANSVKFEEIPLRKILSQHGSNAKVWVKYGENKNFGFIKEIQRHPVTAKIIHVDLQLVSKNHEIKLQLPITFKGEEALGAKLLQVQVNKSEIDVFGKMALMPDSVVIDISEKELGDTITVKDFSLDKEIKISDKEDEVYASITQIKKQIEEDATEEEEAAK